MIEHSFYLILAALTGGVAAFFLPRVNKNSYQLGLVFGGSYLFAITIIHILPELFTTSDQPGLLGIFVLTGFFLQQLLENFTSGAEHGHIHESVSGHDHTLQSIIMLVLALSVHGFMEGALLSHPEEGIHKPNALLWGILLHKAPAAFALVTILLCNGNHRVKAMLLLLLFSLTSPAGLLTGTWLRSDNQWSESLFPILFALVSGNFLHISTTIVFESSEAHRLNLRKGLISLLGASVAIIAELL